MGWDILLEGSASAAAPPPHHPTDYCRAMLRTGLKITHKMLNNNEVRWSTGPVDASVDTYCTRAKRNTYVVKFHIARSMTTNHLLVDGGTTRQSPLTRPNRHPSLTLTIDHRPSYFTTHYTQPPTAMDPSLTLTIDHPSY